MGYNPDLANEHNSFCPSASYQKEEKQRKERETENKKKKE